MGGGQRRSCDALVAVSACDASVATHLRRGSAATTRLRGLSTYTQQRSSRCKDFLFVPTSPRGHTPSLPAGLRDIARSAQGTQQSEQHWSSPPILTANKERPQIVFFKTSAVVLTAICHRLLHRHRRRVTLLPIAPAIMPQHRELMHPCRQSRRVILLRDPILHQTPKSPPPPDDAAHQTSSRLAHRKPDAPCPASSPVPKR